MLNGPQCRASRALLGISQTTLAQHTGVSLMTIKRFENGSDPRVSVATRLERGIEALGIELIDDGKSCTGSGYGLRLRGGG